MEGGRLVHILRLCVERLLFFFHFLDVLFKSSLLLPAPIANKQIYSWDKCKLWATLFLLRSIFNGTNPCRSRSFFITTIKWPQWNKHMLPRRNCSFACELWEALCHMDVDDQEEFINANSVFFRNLKVFFATWNVVRARTMRALWIKSWQILHRPGYFPGINT